MSRDPFLFDRHTADVLDAAKVGAVITAAGLGRAGVVTRVVDGYDNAVYRVGTSHRTVYLRTPLAADAVEEFAAEYEVMALAAAAVPVPDVLWLELDGRLTGGRPVAVLAEASGRPLDDHGRLGAFESLGETLAALHQVGMPGYWRPDNGRWITDPRTLAEQWLRDRTAELAALAAAGVGLAPTEVDRIAAVLEQVPAAYGTEPPVLLHGDLGPKHVFVNHGRVSCLIDWGEWSGGTPVGEFCRLAWEWDDAARAAIRRGYGIAAGDEEEFSHRVAVITTGYLVGHLHHYWRAGDQQTVGSDLRRLRRLVEKR